MKVIRILPFVAVIACLAAFMATAVWSENSSAGKYESPCVISWDENDGDSTLCVLTNRAAYLEHTLGKAH